MNVKRVIGLSLLASTPACMATYRVSPEQYVPQNNPAQIMVMDNAGNIMVVDQPAIAGDKLVGIESGTSDTVSVAVNQVEDALVRHTSKGKTWALVGGLAAGTGLAVAAVITQGSAKPCKTFNNKPDQGGFGIGGNTQCDTSTPDGITP